MKSVGKHKEISYVIKEIKQGNIKQFSKDFAYLIGDSFDDYMNDIVIIQEYAKYNRRAMMNKIKSEMGWDMSVGYPIDTIHNYVKFECVRDDNKQEYVLRKGAVSAHKGEHLIIPLNMRDGSLICIGKGNSEWNMSAPHGAGRIMSRSSAKNNLSMDEYRVSMKDIYSTCVSDATLDEAPQAYKTASEIINNISDTVEVVDTIHPIYNFKANE
jgi:RNA-splicing ligase RtcB